MVARGCWCWILLFFSCSSFWISRILLANFSNLKRHPVLFFLSCVTSFDEGTGEDLEKSKGRGDQPFNPDWTYPVRRELSMCTRASLVRMHATTGSERVH